ARDVSVLRFGAEVLGAGDLEALLRHVGAARGLGAFGERRYLQDLEVFVADILEPVARVAWRDGSLVRSELADHHIAWPVEPHPAFEHHPEARRRRVKVQII